MSAPKAPTRVLHCHPTFAAGGRQLHGVRLMNALGKSVEHAVVPGQLRERVTSAHPELAAKVLFQQDFPALTGFPSPGRLVAIAEAMKGYDLILTHDRGAMNAVMAHTVFAGHFGLPPLIHHENAFREHEELTTRRNWYRRIAFSGNILLAVPSVRLERIAREVWKVPPARLSRIPVGIDTARFANPPEPGAFRVVKREGERWVGTLADLRPAGGLDRLVRAMSALDEEWQLVIIGEGPERDRISAVADELGMSHRVHLPGAHPDPSKVIGLFDIFALPDRCEQFPLAVVEAMAAGLPLAAPDTGDIRTMVAASNRPFICVPDDWRALGQMLRDLAAEPDLAAGIGKANRERAREHFDEAATIARYRELYGKALGREI